jgi:hypothetical protein
MGLISSVSARVCTLTAMRFLTTTSLDEQNTSFSMKFPTDEFAKKSQLRSLHCIAAKILISKAKKFNSTHAHLTAWLGVIVKGKGGLCLSGIFNWRGGVVFVKRWLCASSDGKPVLESLNCLSGFCSNNTILCQVSLLASPLCTSFVSHLHLELLFLPTGNSRNRSRVSNCAIPSTPALSSNIREWRCRFNCPFWFASRRCCRTQSMAPIIMSRSVIPAPTPIPVYAATDSSRGA